MVSLGTALVLSLLHTSAIPNVQATDTAPTVNPGAPPGAANISQIVDDLKAAAVKKVVIVAAQGVLSDADQESLREAADAAGLVVLLSTWWSSQFLRMTVSCVARASSVLDGTIAKTLTSSLGRSPDGKRITFSLLRTEIPKMINWQFDLISQINFAISKYH